MSLTFTLVRRVTGLTAVAGVVSLAAACTVSKTDSPTVSAPSEFGTSITLAATPEVLTQDGVSKAVVTAIARDAASRPVKGLTIRWDATATTTRVLPVALSATTSLTDAEGRAAITLTAPETPTEAPFSPEFIVVNATPMSGNVDQVEARTVRIQLQAPAGVLTPNFVPVARFSINPRVAIINEPVTFNAASTTDEGEPCLSRCTYLWEFGDGTTGSGIAVTHVYAAPDSTGYVVTLTVRDDRSGIGSTTGTVVVNATAPVARFTIVPAVPQVGVEAMFDGSASTTGSGAAISMYTWDFGDGVTVSTATPTAGHTYTDSRIYVVTLTVTATMTNGQTAITASTARTVTVP